MVDGTPRRRCQQPAVAALNRGNYSYAQGPGKRHDSWWAYCVDHLYGRWIEDGVLMVWAVAAVDPEVAR